MLPYYVYILILFICIFVEENTNGVKAKDRVFKCALAPYFILMAFKCSDIGSDTRDYFASFSLMADCDFSHFLSFNEMGYERIEKGYKLLIWLLSRITPDAQILLLVTAIISSMALYYYIKETASNRSLALFFFITLGFFQFAMSGIRQTIAISITLFGYRYLKDRNLVKLVTITIVAMLFHKSAIFFTPMFYVAGIKLNSKNITLSMIGMLVLYFGAERLLFTAADVLDYNYGIEETGNGFIFFAIVLLITILSLNSRRELLLARPLNKIIININIISLAIWTLRLMSRTAERVSLYFMPYSYIALEQYLSTRKKGNKYVFILVAFVLCSFLCLRRLSRDDDFNTFHFFFSI